MSVHDAGTSDRCAYCAELEAELEDLRAQLRNLRTRYDELLKSTNDRDYEKPPHYR